MNPVERAVRRVDRYQQEHHWLGLPFGVIKKYGDDNGGRLAAMLTYSAFFALFPLLLLLVTVLGFALGHNAALRQRVVHSALAEFPIIGTQLGSNVHSLRATGLGLVIGIAGLIWGARGLTQAAQHSMAEVWNIPGVDRPSFWTRQLRGAVLLAVFGLGLVATTVLTALVGGAGQSGVLHAVEIAASAVLNTALFLLAYRVLTPAAVRTRQLIPGAVLAGLVWQALLALGSYLVAHFLRHASDVYGFFGVVMGLLSWLYLGAELTVYAAEVNVVLARRLWPRSIVQPPLTAPDKRILADLAKQEERRPEQTVRVSFKAEANPDSEDGRRAARQTRPKPVPTAPRQRPRSDGSGTAKPGT
jgi:YihY family inner membrane protein